MNKISQSIIQIAQKLSNDGLTTRASQFKQLADDLQQELNMTKTASSNLKNITITKQETEKIDVNQLKQLFNKPLTDYRKYKE